MIALNSTPTSAVDVGKLMKRGRRRSGRAVTFVRGGGTGDVLGESVCQTKGPSGGAQGANKYSCSLRELELCSQVIYIIWTCLVMLIIIA